MHTKLIVSPSKIIDLQFMKSQWIKPNLPDKVFKTSPGNKFVSLVVSFCQVSLEDLQTHLLSTVVLFKHWKMKYNWD